MNWPAILGAVFAAIVFLALGAVIVGVWALARMEQYQRDLEGVEIHGGQVHDVDPGAGE